MDEYEIVTNPDSQRWVDIVKMAEEEFGWKASKHDYVSYMNGYGKDGKFRALFLVDPKTRETVASVMAAIVETETYNKLMTIGYFFVKKELRGAGLGGQLFKKLCGEEEQRGMNLCLVAAPEMSVKYAAKHGFVEFSWHIAVLVTKITDLDLANFEVDNSIQVSNIDQIAWDQIVSYDELVQGHVKRGNFLKAFLSQEGAVNKFVMNDMGTVVGYCNVRIVGVEENHLRIAPFYAQDKDIAAALLKGTLLAFGEKLQSFDTVVMCPPKHNQEAFDLLNAVSHGKTELAISYPRQFTKIVIPAKEGMIYSISDYVLGHA